MLDKYDLFWAALLSREELTDDDLRAARDMIRRQFTEEGLGMFLAPTERNVLVRFVQAYRMYASNPAKRVMFKTIMKEKL